MAHYPWEKSYPPGVKWELDIPKKTLHQIFEESCAQYGDKPFTDFLDKVMSFKDYKIASDHAAAGFQKLGVKPGVNVGLYLPNTPHYIIAFFGVLKAGGRVVNYSPLDAARELEFKIGDSETDILVTLDVAALYPKMAAMKGKTRLKKLIVGSIADYLPWPKNWLYPIAKKKEISSWPRDDWHMSFKDLLANDGKYTAHKSKTFAVPVERLCDAFASARLRKRWLDVPGVKISKVTAPKWVRMRWGDGAHVEVGFVAKGAAKSQAAIQHGDLPDQAAVTASKAFWNERLDLFERHFKDKKDKEKKKWQTQKRLK